jgi:undecaprenyl-diphosphatase
MNFLDILVNNYITHIRSPFVTQYMLLVSAFFDISILSILLTILIAILIKIIRGKKYAWLFIGSIYTRAIVAYLLKLFFNVARPTNSLVLAFGPSFPSYHATVAAVFFIMLIYIFDDYLRGFWRITFNIVCVFLIFLVAFSRVYLGVHWLSDVSVGILIGSILSYLAILIFRKFNQTMI